MQGDESCMPRLGRPGASLVIYRSLVKQISPDKNMNCHCTAASFTVAVRSRGFDVLCHLAFSLRLRWCFCSSARSFPSWGLLLVRPASFRPPLAGWPLPFASS